MRPVHARRRTQQEHRGTRGGRHFEAQRGARRLTAHGARGGGELQDDTQACSSRGNRPTGRTGWAGGQASRVRGLLEREGRGPQPTGRRARLGRSPPPAACRPRPADLALHGPLGPLLLSAPSSLPRGESQWPSARGKLALAPNVTLFRWPFGVTLTRNARRLRRGWRWREQRD